MCIFSVLTLVSCNEDQADPKLKLLQFQIISKETGKDYFSSAGIDFGNFKVTGYLDEQFKEQPVWKSTELDDNYFIITNSPFYDVQFLLQFSETNVDTLTEERNWNNTTTTVIDDYIKYYLNGEFVAEIDVNGEHYSDYYRPDLPVIKIVK